MFSLSCTSDLSLRKTYVWQLPSTFYAYQIAASDFDGDGRQDVAVIGSDIHLFRGRGDGTFDDPVVFPGTSSSAQLVSIADLNLDGRPDIVMVAPRKLVVILNQSSSHGRQ